MGNNQHPLTRTERIRTALSILQAMQPQLRSPLPFERWGKFDCEVDCLLTILQEKMFLLGAEVQHEEAIEEKKEIV